MEHRLFLVALATVFVVGCGEDVSDGVDKNTTDTEASSPPSNQSDGVDGADGVASADGQDGVDSTAGVDLSPTVATIDIHDIQLPDKITYYNTIAPIMNGRCVRCHSKGGIRENSPLDSYQSVYDLRVLIKDQVTQKTMPPYLAGDDCRDYANDERLTEPLIAAISEWADGEAEEGNADEQAIELPVLLNQQMSSIDVKLTLPVEYSPKSSPDDYRCFLLDWPEEKTKFVTGFGALPDNYKIVHHIIAYVIPPSKIAMYDAFDAADEGPGYECFGGPEGKGGDGLSGATWLGAWAPGGEGSDLYPGTGIKVEPGSKIAFQVHYNVLKAKAEVDRSSVVFKLSDSVQEEATLLPWTNFQWLISKGMKIPAGEKDVKHTFSASIHEFAKYLTGQDHTEPVKIYGLGFHMHTLGVSGTVFIERADGTVECLLDQPNYDFNWQRTYAFPAPIFLNPGDKLGLECHWDNSPENQLVVDGEKLKPQDVYWGDGTTDEMCLGVFYTTGLPFKL